MVNFGQLTAETCWRVWGTPANFNRFRVLAALLHGILVMGVSQTAALNRGRHLYSTGRPSRWALAHILVTYIVFQENVPPLACYNLDTHEWILISFGRNVTDKVGNEKTLYYATSSSLVLLHYLTKRGNTKITFFTQLDCVTRTMHLCAVFLKEKKILECGPMPNVMAALPNIGGARLFNAAEFA